MFFSEKTLINGRPSSKVSFSDRGFQYGDGLFETIAVYKGKIPFYDFHLNRLKISCHRLKLSIPDLKSLDEEIKELCSEVSQGVLKIILTRGISEQRGYRIPHNEKPTRVLSIYPWPNYPIDFFKYGITLRICATTLGHNPMLSGIKHLNRLEQILARSEWNDPQIPEGVMLDSRGQVISGTMSNIFIFISDYLQTPDLNNCGVAGVMREFILQKASTLGIKTIVKPINLDDLKQAEEMFVCNSLIGLWPVRYLEEISSYPVSTKTRNIQNFIQMWIESYE
ncbi:aminodeoxychorismate lyase [Candidatus Nitrosacidococcus tergens]|uniref:Aminodeoxychorismate lyase n=1 Tax=Candidatus Nitrosacidococcus tergens TaxID=553981 RepID=A0A7G1Q9F7_9GAMM|nr:aminodeoxychorismate lyase [Candidatus Nitrosacidococcus tergens]CAB1275926.1 Aminodeoxychorismate lyase [Candidatus Nitrosacidococcus tergens]